MRKKCCVGNEEMQDMLLEYQIQNDVFYTQKKEPQFLVKSKEKKTANENQQARPTNSRSQS